MKKLVSLALALVMILSLSVFPVFAESTAPSVLYIDVAGVADSEKTINYVLLWVYVYSGTAISNEEMTHVSGTIYSCDISAVSDPKYNTANYAIIYTDGSSSSTYSTTTFEIGKNLFTATADSEGTWSTYTPASETPAGPSVTNGSQNVTGKYVAGAQSGIIYKIDISWGSMAFTYTAASKGTWNAGSHTYSGAKAAEWTWTDGDNKITVTNHSNDGITVMPSYTPDTGYENATMDIAPAALSLGSADNGENGAAGTATTGTITVTPGGSIPEGTSGKIGQITLSLSGQPVEVSDEESLVAALSAGRTAKLAGDFSVSNAITVSASSVLDLNGHVLSTSNPVNIATGGSLTIMDSAGNGKLTSTATAIQNQGGTLVVNSGTIESCYNAVALYGGTTQLNGGTFHTTGSSYAILVPNSLTSFSITGGNYTGGQYSIYDSLYNLTITGGTFEKPFNTPNWTVTITVTGGTYGFDPTAHIDATVCYVKDNEDGTYTVLPRDENTTLPIMQNVDSLAKLTSVTKTGGTATLTAKYTFEVTETQTLSDGVTMTLDLNGKTLPAASSISPVFSVPATATLNLTDSGSGGMLVGLSSGTSIEVDGTLNVQGGDVKGGTSVQINESGKATFSGGAAIRVDTSGTLTLSGGSIPVLNVKGGKTTVSGGTVDSIIQITGGALEVTSGSVRGIDASAGTVTISGGTITGMIDANGTSSIIITGGTITENLKQKDSGSLTITGGTFSKDPTDYVPEGYTVTTNTDGTYTVTAKS